MKKLEMGETEYKSLARTLHKVDFFAPFTVAQLDALLPHIRLYSYESGERIFKRGDPGDAFYIIYEGRILVSIKRSFFSFTKKLAVLSPGDFFGEMALLDRSPRSAAVKTEEGTKLFVLLADDFEAIVKKNPAFGEEVRNVARRRKFENPASF